MELKDTIDFMLSDDYKDRLKAEYLQLQIRVNKIMKSLKNNDKSKKLRQMQLTPMLQYKTILAMRLEEAGIEIKEA